jgi:hypothetical protein
MYIDISIHVTTSSRLLLMYLHVVSLHSADNQSIGGLAIHSDHILSMYPHVENLMNRATAISFYLSNSIVAQLLCCLVHLLPWQQ